ncbi:MAG: choice-of-anchor D domain-containing protein [Bacteroidota bacterium]|nr:choice-of-anchor D domain-containing protein [Bacteroidota bacterium]
MSDTPMARLVSAGLVAMFLTTGLAGAQTWIDSTRLVPPDSVHILVGICDPVPRDTVIVISNTGPRDVIVSRVSLSNDSSFSLEPPPSLPFIIRAGGKHAIGLRFAPLSASDKYTTVLVESDAAVSPRLRVPVHGRKESAEVSALSLYFGTLTPNLFPATGTVLLRNIGTVSVTVDTAFFGAPVPFLVLPPFGRRIEPNKTDSITVSFLDPGIDGYFSDTLTIGYAPSCRMLRILVAGTRLSASAITGPSTLRYPDMLCKLGTKDTVVRLSSTGAYTLRITRCTIDGHTAFSIPSRLPKDIPAGRSDTLTVRFSPPVPGFYAATLRIENNSTNKPEFPIVVSAVADTPTITVPHVDFGAVYPSQFPALRTISIRNPSLIPITVDSVSISPKGPFLVSAPFPMTIAPLDSAVLDVLFTDPAVDGVFSASMTPSSHPSCTITPSDIRGERRSLPRITGPASVDFGVAICADDYRDTVLVIANPGGAQTVIHGFRFAGTASFSLPEPPALPLLLQPEGVYPLRVRFHPLTTGSHAAVLIIESNAAGMEEFPVSLFGWKDSLGLASRNVEFDTCGLAQLPLQKSIRLTNTGTVHLRITAAHFLKTAPFRFVSSLPFDIAPGDSADAVVVFDTPPSEGMYEDTLLLETVPPCAPFRIVVRGSLWNITSWDIPRGIAFPPLLCDGDTHDTDIVIRNTGTVPFMIAAASIDGDTAFSFTSPFQPFTLAPGGSASVRIRFRASIAGEHRAVLTLADTSTPALAVHVPLVGKRELAALAITPVDFGTVSRFSTPVRRTTTIRNIGTIPILLRSVSGVPPFSTTFPTLSSLQPGDSSEVEVVFERMAADSATSASLPLAFEPACELIALHVRGAQVTPTAVLHVGSTAAAPLEDATIPVTLSDARYLQLSGATAFRMRLRFNKSLLFPLSHSSFIIDGNDRVLDVEVPAKGAGGDTLATILFRAALGDDTTTLILPETVEAVGGFVDVTASPGHFRLSGICREGGVRLLDPDGMVALHHVAPNPFNPRAHITFEVIEAAPTRLSVYDNAGRLAAALVDDTLLPGKYTVTFDASAYPSGVYHAVLETPTIVLVRSMVLLK